jgi:hypothetical protein
MTLIWLGIWLETVADIHAGVGARLLDGMPDELESRSADGCDHQDSSQNSQADLQLSLAKTIPAWK